jgi:hypothetical protein
VFLKPATTRFKALVATRAAAAVAIAIAITIATTIATTAME